MISTVSSNLQALCNHQGIGAYALALGGAVLVLGLAYVFQPALAAWRRPRDHEPYTFTRYAPGSGLAPGTASSPGRRTRASAKAPTGEMKEESFPTLADAPAVLLSLVIPAYNEEVRLPVMLDTTLEYLEAWSQNPRSSLTYELIVVDDGSTDATVVVASEYSRRLGSDVVRVLRLRKNRGKGGAIREGMLHARGRYALMVDADGATDITCLERLLDATQAAEQGSSEGSMAVGVGSRAHYEKDSVATRAWYRTVLMKGLHLLVTVLISGRIRDTQCGFKLFTRGAIKVCFTTLHLERWGFDLEIVHVCDRLGVPMAEVPVRWQEVEGSKLITNKLDVVLASIGIFRDMLCVRICYLLGLWRTAPYSRAGLWPEGGKFGIKDQGVDTSQAARHGKGQRRRKAE